MSTDPIATDAEKEHLDYQHLIQKAALNVSVLESQINVAKAIYTENKYQVKSLIPAMASH